MRRKRAPKRDVIADPKYNSKLVSKFINIVMLKGKKSTSEKIVYGAFDIIKKTGSNRCRLYVNLISYHTYGK